MKSDGSQGVDFLNTASGTVSVTEGGFLGVDVLVPIEGTSANITSSLVGSFALRDVSANVIGVSYTLTGLAPNSDFGLRVERDTSCSLAFGARKGEMYDEELYGAGDNASPWNGGWYMFVGCCCASFLCFVLVLHQYLYCPSSGTH